MKKKQVVKRMTSVLLVAALIFSLVACSDEEEKSENKPKENETQGLEPMTTENITLRYCCWQDIEISKALEKEFEKLYPNIDVVVEEYEISSSSGEDPLLAFASINNLPDCFWVLGSPDILIKNNRILDMSSMWEADPDARNVIKGINEYKLGYHETEHKWTTTVKFFPYTAFVNLDVFIRNDKKMPNMDWNWDEFEKTVEAMTMKDKVDGSYIYGCTGSSIIQWYPLASDKNCIGEFGWNGTEYNMEKWAYGMNLEAKWMQNENKPYPLDRGGVEKIQEKCGEGVIYPQDVGKSAITLDNWWVWEEYWIKDDWLLDNKVVYVPYMLPHTEEAKEGNYLAIMDMGAISADTEHPREAYELLKFMTWGPQGWKEKIKYYPDLLEESMDETEPVAKNNMPITLDESVWEGFIKWHPNSTTGDALVNTYGAEYDRSEYFEYFMDRVQKSKWVCYAGQQIPGFDNWLQNVYNGKDGEQDFGYDGGLGIELACIEGKVDAFDYYKELQEKANSSYKEALKELKEAGK